MSLSEQIIILLGFIFLIVCLMGLTEKIDSLEKRVNELDKRILILETKYEMRGL